MGRLAGDAAAVNNSYRTTLTIKTNGNGEPKAWSLIKYTVTLNVPLEAGGHTTLPVENVQSVQSWPDDPVDITPASVGSSHPAVITEGYMEAFIRELPAMANCPGTSGVSGGGMVMGPNGFMVPATPPGGGGGPTQAGQQGGQGAGGSGEGTVGVPP